MTVLGEAIYPTVFARLRRRAQPTGRLSVDVAVDPPVDQPQVPHAIVHSVSLGSRRDRTSINRQNPNRTAMAARYWICVRYLRTSQ
jgi:hypothetical protein